VNLSTGDVAVARAIARKIRESSGGFPYVKAIGVMPKGRAQVAINFTNFARTSLDQVYDAIRDEADRLGTGVLSSELIGFVPRGAYGMAPAFFERAENFDESRILENKIAELE
jgi:glutamate formiminotransferase